jgi:DNA-binding GntR family transcriptional regulator
VFASHATARNGPAPRTADPAPVPTGVPFLNSVIVGLPLDDETFSRWEARNRAFHEALTSRATSRWTKRFQTMIYDHHERYRRMSHLVGNRSRDVSVEHAQICAAALARDADEACRLSAQPIQRTTDAIR